MTLGTILRDALLSKMGVPLSNLGPGAQPLDEEGWRALRLDVLGQFTPGTPVDEYALFAGRKEQIQKLEDTVVSRGKHAVVFGERGVGKTSLVKIFYLDFPRVQRAQYIYVQCNKSDTFDSIWKKAFRRVKFTIDNKEVWADQLIEKDANPDEIEIILSNFSHNDLPLIVFDEFDRVLDKESKRLMSETIKQLSNSASTMANCTIILVGVADSVISLIDEHHSISRALNQIQMPRMHLDELKEIVTERIRRTARLKISDDALWRIAFLASGLPFYAHALGQAAALAAIARKDLSIGEADVNNSLGDCFGELDQSLIDGYTKATVETRKGNIFTEVLAACSLAEQDQLGRFSAASVEAPLTAIIGREMKTPSFSFHLNELCGEERGGILQKLGQKGHFRFRFIEPIMQPYITMKSLADQIIDNEILERFSIQRQRRFSI